MRNPCCGILATLTSAPPTLRANDDLDSFASAQEVPRTFATEALCFFPGVPVLRIRFLRTRFQAKQIAMWLCLGHLSGICEANLGSVELPIAHAGQRGYWVWSMGSGGGVFGLLTFSFVSTLKSM